MIKYTDLGYIDMKWVFELPYTFIFIVAARGTGKSYGLAEQLYNYDGESIYLRRKEKEIDLISLPRRSPFQAVMDDGKAIVDVETSKNAVTFLKPKDDGFVPFCYGMALSTFNNVRSVNFESVKVIGYDEFIRKPSDRPIKDEGNLFLDVYETVNRNRELQGKPPVKAILCANSNNIANEIMVSLNIVTVAEKMIKQEKDMWVSKERGVALLMPTSVPISQKKKETALYKLIGDNNYSEMALKNNFLMDDSRIVKSLPLKSCIPIVTVGELTVYKIKGNGYKYYVSTHKSGTPEIYPTGDNALKSFARRYLFLWHAYLDNNMVFETYYCSELLKIYFK